MTTKKPLALIILDGFGIAEDSAYNAVNNAHMPTWRQLWKKYPHALLDASGAAVGLPANQIGNSEVGHMTIGAGRIVYQELTRIDQAIADKSFTKNAMLLKGVQLANQNHRAIHIMGLLSWGGVHSHENHFFELLRLCASKSSAPIYVHAFLDGRDIAPKSAASSLQKLQALSEEFPQIHPASIMGRYYAMDRDQRWERTEQAYNALTLAQTPYQAPDVLTALAMAYERGESDEFVKPTWISGGQAIENQDIVYFVNFRADRTRQLSRAFLLPQFDGFVRRAQPQLAAFISMTEYAKDIPSAVAFPPQNLSNALGEYLAKLHKTQLRIAETEKYAHVTFFFNGGQENPFSGEERILVPSPKVATYDLQPEMNAAELTDKLTAAIRSQRFDFIVCNYANPDMVGHSGNYAATIKALETIDICLAKIWQALQAVNGAMLITADHGNADCLYDENVHQPHTAHTMSLVPLLYVGEKAEALHTRGTLADIAPSILSLMQLPIPIEMTGKVMFKIIN